MTFLFPSDDVLLFALTSGLVPPPVSRTAARFGRDSAGRTWIATRQSNGNGLARRLGAIGVQSIADDPDSSRDIAHWMQAIPLQRDPAPPRLTDQSPVLFELADGRSLAQLTTEILRLGNDRLSIRIINALSDQNRSYLLHAFGPPYYSLLRALDHTVPHSPRAYREIVPGLWIEAGWTHPLAHQLVPARGQILLLRPPQEWIAIDNTPFADVYAVLNVARPRTVVDCVDSPNRGPIAVPLSLVTTTTTEPAELWVVRCKDIGQVDALVRDSDDRLLARLAFAVGEVDGERVAVLRARPHRDGPPTLTLDAALMARSYLKLPHLYLPVGTRLTPPLRREAVRQLLASDLNRVVWLAPRDGGSFVPQSLPESAFCPLTDWVEYVVERETETLTAWMEASRFDFGSFIGREEATPSDRPPQRQRKPRSKADAPSQPKANPVAPKAKTDGAVPRSPDDLPPERQPLSPTELQVQLKLAEDRFLSIDGPLDDPRRQALWPELARVNGRLGHQADATLCWSNAIWEMPHAPEAWAWAWVEAEHALPKPELTSNDLDRLLVNAQPTGADVRRLAAVLVWAARQKPLPRDLRRRMPEVQHYLEQHDHLLPFRVVWLVWHGLVLGPGNTTGGHSDILLLARVRDRILSRLLTDGLGAERDLPGFLRYVGLREGERLRNIVERAERLRGFVHEWFADPAVGKGEFDQTPAYIDLLFAFSLARFGESGSCRNLCKLAASALDDSGQEVHDFLLQAFQFRIDQVLAGQPHVGPLPTEQLEYLQQLHTELDALPNTDRRKFGPYAIERMRKESRLLEPQEEFDPYRHSQRFQDALIAELLLLPDVRDRGELSARVRKLVRQSLEGNRLSEIRLRILAGALPLAARVGQTVAEEILQQITPALDAVRADERGPILLEQQAVLLERAMLFAAHFDRPDLVQSFVARLERLMRTDSSGGVLGAVASVIGQSLRSLRKLGLRDESERLLKCVSDAVLKGGDLDQAKVREGRNWLGALRLLLNVASGWVFFDAMDLVQPILEETRQFLLRKDKGRVTDRPQADKYVAVVCAYVAALAHAPLEEAGGRVEELFTSGRLDPIPNSYTTQTYYSRLHLNIVEAVVLALASDDFALGHAARRWLDDDEFLVRRRIHRDMRAALTQAGM